VVLATRSKNSESWEPFGLKVTFARKIWLVRRDLSFASSGVNSSNFALNCRDGGAAAILDEEELDMVI